MGMAVRIRGGIKVAGLALVGLGSATTCALAHPHIFVEARVEFLTDPQGRFTGVTIDWTYDDLISLALLSDRGMDADFDGVLTADELAKIQGFDMGWEPGFQGDSYALLDGVAVALGAPVTVSATYADARLSSRHTRMFPAPVALAPGQVLTFQSYDPGYYTNYTVEVAVITGLPSARCTVDVYTPDLDLADQRLKDSLAELTPDQNAEEFFPAIGAEFAEEARVTCPAG
jgi:ABC-type uncharacterized transport system substrate-binding protein